MQRFLLACFLLSILQGLNAQVKSTDFFDSEEVVSMRLEAPIATLKKYRNQETGWLEGMVHYETSDGERLSLNVKIEARGKFRRRRSTCNFPPYWLNFKKSEVMGTVFEGLDKVKVVSHCEEGRRSFEPYILTEYLTYKTFNLMTDRSYQVRLARIDYFDTDIQEEYGTFSAFFIEPNENLEARLSATQVKDKFVLPSRMNHRDVCIADMFQYFAGNTDFSFFAGDGVDECCHNAKVFAVGDAADGLTPIPYDFDMSGLIYAPYAEPDPNFELRSVRQRLYRGIGVEHKILEDTMRLYLRKKKAVYALWEGSGLLEGLQRKRVMDFIDYFYETFENQDRVHNRITKDIRHIDSVEKMIRKAMDKAQASNQ